MATKKKAAPRKTAKKKKAKRFCLQFGWTGAFGLAVVTFCLFLWMFLLGIWAGQTILLPAPPPAANPVAEISGQHKDKHKTPVKILRPAKKKSRVGRKE